MGYLLVLLAATAAGVGTAAFTLRQAAASVAPQPTWSQGSSEPPTEAAVPIDTGSTATGPATAERSGGRAVDLPAAPTWESRVNGIVGLVIAVLLGAGALAAAFYMLWSLVAKASRAFGTT